MPPAAQLTLDAQLDFDRVPLPTLTRATAASATRPEISLSLHETLAEVEDAWREFEAYADATVFQTFDWLATWQHHVGERNGVKPVIVIGRHEGKILFLMPFAIEPHRTLVRLVWLASYISNYNAPLLAPGFSRIVSREGFVHLWRQIGELLASRYSQDLIDLEKMPEIIGTQVNPFRHVGLTPHVNDAYLTHLSGTWESFYNAKRSNATRKRDRKKRKYLSEHGPVALVTAAQPAEITRTLDALIEEKTAAYGRLGVANMFDWPGYRAFFEDYANRSPLAHVCSLNVGDTIAAANYGLIFRGTYYYILAGYGDGELARFGPGMAQLHELLRYSIERGLRVFDFTIGDEAYKREWLDTDTPLYDCVTPATWRGFLLAATLTAVRRVKRRIKQDHDMWARVRKVRAVIGPMLRTRAT